MFVFSVSAVGMRIAILLGYGFFSAATCEAEKAAEITCGVPVRENGSSPQRLRVPVKITNTSHGPIRFLAGGTPYTFQEFVTRERANKRWRDITISMEGICMMGYRAPEEVVLIPGESFESSSLISAEYAGQLFCVSLKVGKPGTSRPRPVNIFSAPILLR